MEVLFFQMEILFFRRHIDFKNLNRFEHFLRTHSLEFERDFKNEKAILSLNLNEEEEQKFEIFCAQFTPFEIEKL